jgi:hypothetical protein
MTIKMLDIAHPPDAPHGIATEVRRNFLQLHKTVSSALQIHSSFKINSVAADFMSAYL